MVPFVVLLVMEQNLENGNMPVPPRGLFAHIIRRLGLEQRLDAVKRRLTFTEGGLIVLGLVIVFAVILIIDSINRSNFGHYMSLAFSDARPVMRHLPSFALSVSESLPGFRLGGALLALAGLMLLGRWASFYTNEIGEIIRSIRKNKHE